MKDAGETRAAMAPGVVTSNVTVHHKTLESPLASKN